ncbi:MAG: enoyl-CoA hydratase [Crocinitomicaceae bacterium]|nr:enoyl-CoA hydratase [Crocinitomicaceae bacterium]|tara:strand:+ start:1423 stop:2178 length:756 start_codon:yes stop_codon:yes gene_type:complete
MDAFVKSEHSSGICTIEFFHPSSNSLPSEILASIANSITEAGSNDDARVIILKSFGNRAFCAGASFDELVAISNEEEGLKFFSGFANVINAIRLCPKFVIGRVQGKAVGGGVGIASAVDHCFATKHAAVKLSELAIGIGPFVVGPAVERKLGTSGFSQLTIDATSWKDANWAAQYGLYSEVFDTADQMDIAVTNLAEKLAKSSQEAIRELKKVLWAGTEGWDTLLKERAAISGRLVLSDFTRNAIAALKNK